MRKIYVLLVLAASLIVTPVSNAQSRLDSIVTYAFADATDSVPDAKQYFDTYDDNGNLVHKVTYTRDGNGWAVLYEESYAYDEDGMMSAYEKICADHVGDMKVEYIYDKDGNLTEEVVYSNKNAGEMLDPEWERALKKEYTYNAGVNDLVTVSAFVKYWQPVRQISKVYDASNRITSEKVFKWLPEVKVKEFEGVYGQNPGSTSNYLFRAYKIEQTVTSLDDLADILVPDATTVVNIFKEDGTRIDVTDNPGGKSLKELLEGAGITTISQLRDNYREWFKTVEEDNVTLINLNIKAGRPFEVQEVVKTTSDLYTYNDNYEYLNTAFWVKGAATLDDLAKITIDADADWVNIYLKDDEPGGRKYRRVDVTGADAAGKTIAEIFGDSISVDDLYQDYEEIFYDKQNNRKYVRLNVKEVKMSPTGSTAIDVYKKLYAKSDDYNFILNAYKVNSGATAGDLGQVVISDDAQKVTVYKADGSRVDITSDIRGYTLQQIFDANGLSVADLVQDRVEWFYTSEGKIELLNINVKEEYNIGETEKVKETDSLYSIGTNGEELIYDNTAFYVYEDAEAKDLENYIIPEDAHYLVIYLKLGQKKTIDATPYQGKSLRDLMESEHIPLDLLRHTYWEWFVNTGGRRTLVKLNIKAYREIQPVPVLVVDSLFTGSQGKVFSSTAYLVAETATQADLDAITLPEGLQYLDYYCEGSSGSLHPTTGTVTLGAILKSTGNTEGIDLAIDSLRHNYVEWFINKDGKTKLIKLNFKAIVQENDGSLTATEETTWDYNENGKAVTRIVHENMDEGTETWIKSDFVYDGDNLIREEEGVSYDGSTYTKEKRKEYTADEDGKLRTVACYVYADESLEIVAKDHYYYNDDEQTGIGEQSFDDGAVRLYPNPVADVLTIEVKDVPSFTFRIYTLGGSLVEAGVSSGSTLSLDLSSFSSGIYLLNVMSDKQTFTKKIVKR